MGGGMIYGIVTILSARSVDCFSWKTQVLYQMVYFTRYLDVFTDHQAMYLIFFKITFNLVTAAMISCFVIMQNTYDMVSDSCNILALIIPAAVVTHAVSHGSGVKEELWTFS